MKLRLAFSMMFIAVVLSACNLPVSVNTAVPGITSTSPSSPATLPTATLPTATLPRVEPTSVPTPVPSDTPTPAPTATLAAPMVTPIDSPVVCRFGPGTNYEIDGALNAGVSVPVLGKNSSGGWWQIQDPSNTNYNCWVASTATTVTGDTTNLPIVPPRQTIVTNVSVDQPATIHVAGCVGPITAMTVTGSIEVTGPATVTFHFETQQGGALSSQTVSFTTFGPHSVSNSSYTPPVTAGTYWLKLVVTSPNGMNAQSSYTIACP